MHNASHHADLSALMVSIKSFRILLFLQYRSAANAVAPRLTAWQLFNRFVLPQKGTGLAFRSETGLSRI